VHLNGVLSAPLVLSGYDVLAGPGLIAKPDPNALPEGWNAMPHGQASAAFGGDWLRTGQVLGLVLPSVVVTQARNLLLNPLHPAMAQVVLVHQEPFQLDQRLGSATTGESTSPGGEVPLMQTAPLVGCPVGAILDVAVNGIRTAKAGLSPRLSAAPAGVRHRQPGLPGEKQWRHGFQRALHRCHLCPHLLQRSGGGDCRRQTVSRSADGRAGFS